MDMSPELDKIRADIPQTTKPIAVLINSHLTLTHLYQNSSTLKPNQTVLNSITQQFPNQSIGCTTAQAGLKGICLLHFAIQTQQVSKPLTYIG